NSATRRTGKRSAARDVARHLLFGVNDLQRLEAIRVAMDLCVELDDGLGVSRCFGERHLANADVEAAFSAYRLRVVQRVVQRGELLAQRLGEIGNHEILEMAAEGQRQPLFDRAVPDE